MPRIEVRQGGTADIADTMPPVRVTYMRRHVWDSGVPAVELVVDEVPSRGQPMEVFLGLGEGLVFVGDAGDAVEVVWMAEDAAGRYATFDLGPAGA